MSTITPSIYIYNYIFVIFVLLLFSFLPNLYDLVQFYDWVHQSLISSIHLARYLNQLMDLFSPFIYLAHKLITFLYSSISSIHLVNALISLFYSFKFIFILETCILHSPYSSLYLVIYSRYFMPIIHLLIFFIPWKFTSTTFIYSFLY